MSLFGTRTSMHHERVSFVLLTSLSLLFNGHRQSECNSQASVRESQCFTVSHFHKSQLIVLPVNELATVVLMFDLDNTKRFMHSCRASGLGVGWLGCVWLGGLFAVGAVGSGVGWLGLVWLVGLSLAGWIAGLGVLSLWLDSSKRWAKPAYCGGGRRRWASFIMRKHDSGFPACGVHIFSKLAAWSSSGAGVGHRSVHHCWLVG